MDRRCRRCGRRGGSFSRYPNGRLHLSCDACTAERAPKAEGASWRASKSDRQAGSPPAQAALRSQLRRLAALEATEVYAECLARAAARPRPERIPFGRLPEEEA